MARQIETVPGGPKPTRGETKADITTAVASAIIASEEKAREAKTARLRAARLAQEPEPAAPARPGRGARKR